MSDYAGSQEASRFRRGSAIRPRSTGESTSIGVIILDKTSRLLEKLSWKWIVLALLSFVIRFILEELLAGLVGFFSKEPSRCYQQYYSMCSYDLSRPVCQALELCIQREQNFLLPTQIDDYLSQILIAIVENSFINWHNSRTPTRNS